MVQCIIVCGYREVQCVIVCGYREVLCVIVHCVHTVPISTHGVYLQDTLCTHRNCVWGIGKKTGRTSTREKSERHNQRQRKSRERAREGVRESVCIR